MNKPWTLIALAIFSLVSFGHLVRMAFGIQVIVGGWDVPVWLSAPGMVFPAIIAWMLWRERQRP